jgi:hypothetical protein
VTTEEIYAVAAKIEQLQQEARAEANCAWVRDRIAEQGLTRRIESMAALAIVAGHQSWFSCQRALDMQDDGLYDKHGTELTKALLRIKPQLRTSGEWTR